MFELAEFFSMVGIGKNADDTWGYKGCSTCFKKDLFTFLSQDDLLYNLDLQVSNHTAKGSKWRKNGILTSGWWNFKYVFDFTTIWGRIPIWQAYFSDGLVQPPTRISWTWREKRASDGTREWVLMICALECTPHNATVLPWLMEIQPLLLLMEKNLAKAF